MGKAPKPKGQNGNIRSYFAPAPKPAVPKPPVQPPAEPPTRNMTRRERNSESRSSSTSTSLSVLSRTPSPPHVAVGTPRPATPEPQSAITPRSSSSPGLPALFSTPSGSESRHPISRDAVINASDDDISDEDLAPLEAILNLKPKAAAPAPAPAPTARPAIKDPCATPEAKRRRANFFASPLSVRPRVRHLNFGFDDLLEDARRDNAADASIQQYDDNEKVREAQRPGRMDGGVLRDTLMDMAGDESDHNMDKVVRAVQRTVVGSGRNGWYFFENGASSPKSTGTAFPADVANKICGPGIKKAAQLDIAALNMSLVLSGQELPDELFMWLLEEICVEGSDRRRSEYCERLFLCNGESFTRNITPKCLEQLFKRLGATSDIHNLDSELPTKECPSKEYYQRDWSPLRIIFDILYDTSHNLQLDAIEYCVRMLLRMAVDDEVLRHADISSSHRKLLARLVSDYQRHPQSNWDQFCERMCKAIFTSFTSTSMRLRALTVMPSSSRDLHDLRRRMAAVFLLDDLEHGKHNGDVSLDLETIWSVLHTDKFKARAIKDYTEFRANLGLLDLALDLGNRPSVQERVADVMLARQFNAAIDAIVELLNKISSDIPDGGMKTIGPLEAMMEVDWIKERLKYNVRTRPPKKMSIFDHPKKSNAEPTVAQRKYMESFVGGGSESRKQQATGTGTRSELDDPFRSKPIEKEGGRVARRELDDPFRSKPLKKETTMQDAIDFAPKISVGL